MHMAGIMPFGDVMRMALMGSYERITAQSARRMGMVSEVVAGEDLHEAAIWCASRIAALPHAAVEGTVRSLWAARELGGRRALGFALCLCWPWNARRSDRPGDGRAAGFRVGGPARVAITLKV